MGMLTQVDCCIPCNDKMSLQNQVIYKFFSLTFPFWLQSLAKLCLHSGKDTSLSTNFVAALE
jgi:hypothetical protein